MIEVIGDELVVAGPPPGGFRFGPGQLAEARRFQSTFTLSLEVVERLQRDRATELGMEVLARREAPRRPKKQRKGRRS